MAIQEQFTFQSAVTTNGNGTAADVSGLPGVCVQVEGITTASVIFEGRIGTLTYTGIQAVNLNNGSIATLTAADGPWYVPTAGLEDVRCRVSTYSGGTITVLGRAIYNPAGMTLADIATTTQTDYNVTLTNADTEYSQALPANCRLFEFQCRTDVAVRWSKTTGKVAGPTAPYKTLKAGDYYYSPPLNQAASPDTLYFAAAVGSLVVELTVWT